SLKLIPPARDIRGASTSGTTGSGAGGGAISRWNSMGVDPRGEVGLRLPDKTPQHRVGNRVRPGIGPVWGSGFPVGSRARASSIEHFQPRAGAGELELEQLAPALRSKC